MKLKIEKSYELPDGNVIKIGNELIRCPEIFFNKHEDNLSLQENCIESIKSCDSSIEKILFENVILCGGSSMFEGIEKRLLNELKILEKYKKIKVYVDACRKYSTWFGGSILCTLSSYFKEFIKKEEYEEHGKNIIHKNCFNF